MTKFKGIFTEHDRWIERRQFLKLGGMGALGLVIAASTTDGASAQDQKPSIENIKANMSKVCFGDFNPNYVNKWPIVLGLSLGYMKEGGIDDIEVILSEQYVPGMIGGSLDIVHGDTSVFLGSGEASGTPIKIISIFRDSEYWIMGVRKGIEKPEDLKGATISGGQLDGRNTWVQKQLLMKMGLDPEKDVQFVPTSGASDNRLAALINGTLDAASVFPRHQKPLEAAGGKFLHQELVNAPQEAFGAMGDFISKNEDTVYAFTLADIKARQWLFDPKNKDQGFKYMREYGFEIPPEFEEQHQVELDQLSPDGGFDSAESMDTFLAQLAETGGVPAGIDWRKYMDLTYVWAAQEALGLPKRPASL